MVHERRELTPTEEAFDRIECLVAEHGDENCELAISAFAKLKVVMGLSSVEYLGYTEDQELAVRYYERNPSRAVRALRAAKSIPSVPKGPAESTPVRS